MGEQQIDPETEAGLPVTRAELQAIRDWQPHRFEDVQAKYLRLQVRLNYARERGVIDEATFWEIFRGVLERVNSVLESQQQPAVRARCRCWRTEDVAYACPACAPHCNAVVSSARGEGG